MAFTSRLHSGISEQVKGRSPLLVRAGTAAVAEKAGAPQDYGIITEIEDMRDQRKLPKRDRKFRLPLAWSAVGLAEWSRI